MSATVRQANGVIVLQKQLLNNAIKKGSAGNDFTHFATALFIFKLKSNAEH